MDAIPASTKSKITHLERRIDRLEQIVEISRMINSTLSLDPLLHAVLNAAQRLSQAAACSIILLDPQTGELRFAHTTDEGIYRLEKLAVPPGASIAGAVIKEKKPLFIRDVKSDPRWNPAIDKAIDFDTRSILCVPLNTKDKTIGVLELLNKADGRDFGEEDLEAAVCLADQAAIALTNVSLLEALQQAYNDLAELDRLKAEFVSVASHELRTPLSVILAYASILQEQVSGEARLQLEMVLDSATRLRTIIDDMLNLRHVDSGQAELNLSRFSVNEMIDEICDEFKSLYSAKQQQVTTHLPEKDLPLEADKSKIYLALSNLLSNAIKFTPAGGRIQLTAQKKSDEIWLSVADTGVGIPETELHRIFDRFYQVESSLERSHEGIGLGLSTAKCLVELHSGRIWVESVVGGGSRFTMALPQDDASALDSQ